MKKERVEIGKVNDDGEIHTLYLIEFDDGHLCLELYNGTKFIGRHAMRGLKDTISICKHLIVNGKQRPEYWNELAKQRLEYWTKLKSIYSAALGAYINGED